MIIRATNKIFNISKIKPVQTTTENLAEFPGEWNANLLSQLIPGKFVIQFLHNPTFISILIPGKSIRKAVEELPNRTSDLLIRNGYEKLIEVFDLNSKIEFHKSNDRSIQAYLNNLKYDIEYEFSRYFSDEIVDYSGIEDWLLNHLFGGKKIKGYVSPKKILKKKLDEILASS